MRIPISLAIVFLLPSASFAQNKEVQDALNRKLDTLRYVHSLQQPNGGFAPALPEGDAKPTATLRGTSAAVRAMKYLSGLSAAKDAVPNAGKTAEFVLSCYDPKTGGFADTPGGKPDVYVTAVGVMAAEELDIVKAKFAKAMDYLKENAKTFEDVRIGAAAVEAWGVKDCPFELDEWFKIAEAHLAKVSDDAPKNGGARDMASAAAMLLRLGRTPPAAAAAAKTLAEGQREDGGWGKKDAKASDLETTYRVMRAFHLLKEKPKDVAKLREFLDKCRNRDGGYGTAPGEKSGVGGVYFATIVTKWLDEK